MIRRQMQCRFLALAACAVIPLWTAAADESSGRRLLTVLHTNDIHGHVQDWAGWGDLAGKRIGGMDRLAAAINQVRQEAGEDRTLLLDAGDTIADTMIAARTEGRAVVETLNAIGYDAMVVGNHEPDFGPEVLATRAKEMHFPLLAANLIRKSDNRPFVTPYIIRTINGIRVAILGLAYPNTALTTQEKNVEGLEFRDAIETARAYLPRLRSEAELVIVLSHLGLSHDKELARQVAGIDVVVGGHSHNRMQEALRVGDTLVVQAGAHGSHLGRLDLELENGKVTGHRRDLILIDSDRFERDPDVARRIAAQLHPHEQAHREEVGRSSDVLPRAQTLAGQDAEPRDKESPVDMLFADLIRAATTAELVLLPGVGYGVALSPGVIRAAELRNMIPHDSKVVKMTLTGAQIKEILEQSLENIYTEDPRMKVGGIVQVSGLNVKYKRSAPYGKRVSRVMIGDRSLEPTRRYQVATNSLLASGGHRYLTFLKGQDKQELGMQYEIIRAALKNVTVSPPHGGRMEIEDR